MNRISYCACAALLSSSLPVASAQGADQEPELREAPIIVTLPGPQRTADELISSVAVMDRADLVADLASSLGDTLDRQPGVSSTFFGQGASRPVLRGLGAERVQVLTNGIGVIDASAASPDHQVSADGIDAEKVEILRGPAALVYGGQAIGGVVNVIDGLIAETIPDAPVSGRAYAATSSVNDGIEGGARIQFTTGPIVATLSASGRDLEDYDIPGFAESSALRASEAAEGEGGEDEEEVRGTVENSFAETDTLSAGVSLVGERGFVGVAIRRQSALYGLPGGHGHEEGEEGEAEEAEEEESPFIDLEQTRIDLRGAYDINAGALKRISGAIAIVEYDHTEFEAPGEAGTIYEADGTEGRVELRHGLFGLDGVAGIQIIDSSLGAFGEEAFITPTDTISQSVFVYESRDWDSGFGVEGGARFETVEQDNEIAGAIDFDLFSASFGAHKHFDNGLFLGGQISRAERAPNPSELFADGPHLATQQFEVGDVNLGVETGLNLEATVRWSSETIRLGASVFNMSFDDFIYLSPEGFEEDGLPVFQFRQQDADFTGAELTAEWLPTDRFIGAHWHYEAGLDLVDAELDDGQNVPYIPPVTLNAGVLAHWEALSLGADVSIAAEQDAPGTGQFATDGFTQIDLSASYELSQYGFGKEGTQLFLQVRNAGDEEARTATSVLKEVAPLPGRNVRIGLRAVF